MKAAEAVDQWARQNTMECERLHSMIRPSFCAKYRDNNPICRGCPQAAEMDAAAQGRPVVKSAPVSREEGSEALAKTGKCRCCGEEGKIMGRGLIGSCYWRHRQAGTLDKYPPLTSKGKAIEQTKATNKTVPEDPAAAPAPAPSRPEPETSSPSSDLAGLFDSPRDRELLRRLEELAERQRRTVKDQILCILEDAI